MAAAGGGSYPRTFLDIAVGGGAPSRLEVSLFWAHAPRTCANFLALCSGSHGSIPGSARPLCFRGSRLHRIIPGFMAQGGDITAGDGTGGASIYNGGGDFADENLGPVQQQQGGGGEHGHNRRGLLSMANAGADTNRSQFFILFAAAPHLDGRHVIFGEVDLSKGGAADLLARIEACGSRSGKPSQSVSVADCGEILGGGGSGGVKEEEAEAGMGAGHRGVHSKSAEELRAASDAERRARAVPVAAKKMTTEKAARMLLAKQGGAVEAQAPEGGAAEEEEKKREGAGAGGIEGDASGAPAPADADGAGEERDPTEGMSAKQRRLFQLRLKVNQARKMNQSAVLDEKKRSTQDASAEGRNQARKQKIWEERHQASLEAAGITKDKAYLLQTAEEAEGQYRKREKKDAAFGWDIFNSKSIYRAHKKRIRDIPVEEIAVEALRRPGDEGDANGAIVPASESTASILQSVQHKPSEGAVERMAAELNNRQGQRSSFSRRRRFYEEKDIDGINERNDHFNRKIERAFGKYTAEIKANLERGTALPDF